MDRRQKIKWLNQVQAGTANLCDLKQTSAVIIQCHSGRYRLKGSGNALSEDQMHQHIRGMKTVIMLPDNGR